MSTGTVRPSSIEGIKRLAKKIATEKSVKHTAALEEASKLAGYQSFIHAKRALARGNQSPMPATAASNARTSNHMSLSDFHTRSRANWTAKIDQLADSGDATLEITGVAPILRALGPFMGSGNNHAHLPTGGGFDFEAVSPGREQGSIEFQIFTGTAVVAKPRRLTIERLESDPAESFLLLELDALEPSGTYEDEERLEERRLEEVDDLGRGEYVPRGAIHYGLYIDEDGLEQETPDDAQTVLRLLNGKIMLVSKGSIWNGSSQTYSGLHDGLSATEIRGAIQQILDRR
jgi:hypothetical protein